MESTFDSFINSNKTQKELFEKEYNKFLLSEFIIDAMEKQKLSIRMLAKKANVSPTIIQKIRNSDTAEKINYRTFIHILDILGYRINIEEKENLCLTKSSN